MSAPRVDSPFNRGLEPPLTARQLRPLDPRCRTVQFCDTLSPAALGRLGRFLRDYPEVKLRVFQMIDPPYTDLDFLEHFASVSRVQIDIYELRDVSGLRCLRPDLGYLGLARTKKTFSMRPLERFPSLQNLWLEGHTRDIDVLGGLRSLQRLSLRSITLPDLGLLRPLQRLLELELKLGGTRSLRHLPALTRLRYLELWMVRGLADLRPIADTASLDFLFLQALKQVRTLPSFAPLRRLRRVHLETMRGLRDLRPVAAAPALEELAAIDMGHLWPEAFRPFVGHPTLRAAAIGLNSKRRNDAAERLLPLPPPDFPVTGDFVPEPEAAFQ